MDEALAGHANWIDVEMEADGFVTVTDNGRGIPVDPHPKFKNKSALEVIMCTLHAGGKFDPRCMRLRAGCTASASRSPMRCRSAWKSRSRASRRSIGWRSRAASPRASWKRSGVLPIGAAPRCASVRPGHFRRQGALQAGARFQDGALEGLSVRRRRDPMVMRQGAAARRRGRAGKGDLPFRRRPQGLSRRHDQRRDAGASGHLHRQRRQDRQPRRRRMGGRLDGRCRRLPLVLLQHHPDAGRRHPRVGPAQRAVEGPQGSRRTRRPRQARGQHHQRRRDDRRRRHALGVHP